MDTYQEHLDHSGPCSSRWDGFDRGDIGREDDHLVVETVIGRMTNPFGELVVITETAVDGFAYYEVTVNGHHADWADDREEAVRLGRLRMGSRTLRSLLNAHIGG